MSAASSRLRHEFIELDGIRTHLLRSSSQLDTVLLHGVGGSAWTFERTVSGLGPAVGWASIDLLGYGESSWLEDSADYTTAVQAGRVLRVLDAVGATGVNLVGFSWGGLIALEVAARSPIVERLVMIDIPLASTLPADAVPPIPWSYPNLDAVIETMAMLAPRATREALERDAFLSTSFGPGGLRRKLDPRLLQRFAFREEDHWDAWERNRCETLLIRGQASAVLSQIEAEAMVARAPSVTLAEIEDAGHLIPLEQPARLAELLSDFLHPSPESDRRAAN